MGATPSPVTGRLKQLRQRHFGPSGKRDFASFLGVSLEQYERYERGAVPPPEVLLRACTLTGEDLQWLLTGIASRGTVIISGARARHQDLVARVARILEANPQSARALDAFVDLLEQGRPSASAKCELPAPDEVALIPFFRSSSAPRSLGNQLRPRPVQESAELPHGQAEDWVCESDLASTEKVGTTSAACRVRVVSVGPSDAEAEARWILAPLISESYSTVFAVEVQDGGMSPIVGLGEGVIVSPEVPAELGSPVLCHAGEEQGPRCRIWLGCEAGAVHLGRTVDQERECVAADAVLWSLKILFRLRWAA